MSDNKIKKDGDEVTPSPPERGAGGEVDYYFEGGLMVFTSAYHLKRGSCCKNKCRHCPYGLAEKITASKNLE
jgi:hypothetical protein